MEVYRRSSWLLLLLLVELQFFFLALQGVHGELNIEEGPSESECRPHIEKALKQLENGEAGFPTEDDGDSKEDIPTVEITTDDSGIPAGNEGNEDDNSKKDSNESSDGVKQEESDSGSNERDDENKEDDDDDDESEEQVTSDEIRDQEITVDQILASEAEAEVDQQINAERVVSKETDTHDENLSDEKTEYVVEKLVIINEATIEPRPSKQDDKDAENDNNSNVVIADDTDSNEDDEIIKQKVGELKAEVKSITTDIDTESENINLQNGNVETNSVESTEDNKEDLSKESKESHSKENNDSKESENPLENEDKKKDNKENNKSDSKQDSSEEVSAKKEQEHHNKNVPLSKTENVADDESKSTENDDSSAVEELIEESEEVLLELRPRDHIAQLLKLDEDSSSNSKLVDRMSDIILRDLKKLYDSAIKPLELLYKYKDLSNRHYGDSEIFAKPLILFMGPWSGGKSSIINYLLGIEYGEHSLHTGAEPSPAYFNILMYGEEPEVLDGTQLAADYTFSGLQKFGQGLEERLRGYKLPSKLLEKVNVVEIPGILEVRKQVSRVFPFNDACQWFIDRADIIFLVYDPSKLDVGPETEAILDQLKGREHQTRIILNKADQVKPEELMRVQGALIWNISPLMSSAQPPIMYTASLWSKPYEVWAPVRLLQAQERAFLRDIRSAVNKRIDNKIASARRFAVRVRNHAKMVDCYLTTYYNHKSVFGNRKQISDEIINHPQDFHIYEGLSTLTNISRYDLPDPDVYRDFFRLNALYDFQQLSATCTYFRGCPINRLDIAIAYDLPELVGKHKKLIETAINEANKPTTPKS